MTGHILSEHMSRPECWSALSPLHEENEVMFIYDNPYSVSLCPHISIAYLTSKCEFSEFVLFQFTFKSSDYSVASKSVSLKLGLLDIVHCNTHLTICSVRNGYFPDLF